VAQKAPKNISVNPDLNENHPDAREKIVEILRRGF
jgi:hypothetical protein